ncbi:O-antigen ligase family protein [candidate division WOR-3 bacterium]|nr:O-antigen ligase family protein [candidate division WOR-3 bacterium]
MNSKQSIYKIKSYILNLQYYFRCFSSKTLDIIGKFLSNDYVKTAIVLLLIVFLSYTFSKRIAFGHLRTVIVISLFFLLAAASISLKSGISALIIFLPFMAFIRRYIYVYSRYVPMDPILIISDIITIWLFGYLVIFKGKEIYKLFRENKLVKFTTILLFIFILQMFNPRQGNILVGIGGAKYYIIPFLWFYFGLFIDKRFVRKLFFTIVVIGFITALYGLKQTFLGFTPFESYWIEQGGFSSLHLFNIIRSFSTFSSPSEYSRYLLISSILGVGLMISHRKNYVVSLMLLVILFALFVSAVRSTIFFFLIAIVSLVSILVMRRNVKLGFLFALFLIIFLIALIANISIVPDVNKYSPISVVTHHSMRGITEPLSEDSFQFRLYLWTKVFPRELISNPFGYGLGILTIAAGKFGGYRITGTDNFLLDTFLSTGIIGGILLLTILFIMFKRTLYIINKKKDIFIGTILIVVLAYLTNSSPGEYACITLIWLFCGIVTKEIVECGLNRSSK